MLGGLNNDFVLWAGLGALALTVLSLIVWAFRFMIKINSSSTEEESK